MRIFVADEEGERFGDRPAVLCSEGVENEGAGITEAAEEIRGAMLEAFQPANPLWIEHHGPNSTDGRTEPTSWWSTLCRFEPSWKPLRIGRAWIGPRGAMPGGAIALCPRAVLT